VACVCLLFEFPVVCLLCDVSRKLCRLLAAAGLYCSCDHLLWRNRRASRKCIHFNTLACCFLRRHCCCCLQDAVIEGVIEGRRDIRGGRLASDTCDTAVCMCLPMQRTSVVVMSPSSLCLGRRHARAAGASMCACSAYMLQRVPSMMPAVLLYSLLCILSAAPLVKALHWLQSNTNRPCAGHAFSHYLHHK
jgi:hypothetical protein